MEKNKVTSLLIGAVLVILFVILVNLIFKINVVSLLILCWVLTTFYSIFGFYLLGNVIPLNREVVRQVAVERAPIIKYVEKPVYIDREVAIQIPVENKTIEVVEMERPTETQTTRYINLKKKKLNIPKYKFVGSDETLRYHKTSCRLSKLIKRKNKVVSNSQEYFRKLKYKPCKACLKK